MFIKVTQRDDGRIVYVTIGIIENIYRSNGVTHITLLSDIKGGRFMTRHKYSTLCVEESVEYLIDILGVINRDK